MAPSESAAVAHLTVTSRPDSALRLMVKLAVPPSVTAAASPIDSVGLASSSSSATVPSDTVSEPELPVRLSDSSSSSRSSSVGVRVNLADPLLSPAAIVTVKGSTAV